MLRRAAAPLHTVPLFLPWMHRSRAHLVSDGLAPPPARFPSALSTPLPSVHGTCIQSNAAYWGGVKKLRGSGQPFSMFFFFPLLRWNRDEIRVPNPALLPAMQGKPVWPLHPTAGFTQIRKNNIYCNRLVGGKRISKIFFSQMSEKVGSCLCWL